jgi:hypothetical protein
MTNGGDRHHGVTGKKKTGTEKPKDAKAKLKRKNLLPKALAGAAKR